MDQIATWLQANGLPSDALVTTDGQIPATPDRIVSLAGTGGQGGIKERALDSLTLQVITRDGQGRESGQAAEPFANTVDAIFMGAQPPIRIGSKHIPFIDGGPPTFLDRDTESQRVSMVAVYTIWVARDVH